MSHATKTVRPSGEIVFLPQPTVKPIVTAFGLLGLMAGTFMGTPYLLVGAVLFLAGLIGWIADSRRSYTELPREQSVTTSVVPPLRDTESAAKAEPAAS